MTRTPEADCLSVHVTAARGGDVAAYGRVVQSTQAMALAVAVSVLRDPAGAEDAVQEAYLRAYRRLGDLEDPAAFPGWLRRIVITAALNARRARLAEAAGMTETTMRKRLQRIRDRLRRCIEAEEIEMAKERGVDPAAVAGSLPAKIVELLASPRLTDIPENPVGRMLLQLRETYPEFAESCLKEAS
jgi:hypothetical protein